MLNSDSKRQAVHSLRGYAYQIWQSLNEWLALSEDEILVLEGAEDIDKLWPGQAETIQVKDIQSGSVTLNSEAVIDSIKHYWQHRKLNSTIRITYRFLTTAERGKEQSNPFGEKNGLDYWDDCKRKGADLKPLRDFLQAKDQLPDDLRKFIGSADDEAIRSELIVSLEWDTGNPEREYLEQIILEKLKKVGLRYGILPAVSERVLPALLKFVFEKASDINDRKLDNLNLAEQLQANTTVTVPANAMIAAVSALAAQFEGMVTALPAGTTPQLSLIQQNITPALPNTYARRQKLVASLKENLLNNKFLVLHGSTGMGKSTLAALLVNSLGMRNSWVNLRGVDPNSTKGILLHLAVNIKKMEDVILIVDDISFGVDANKYENATAGLINLVLGKNGYVVITTQDDLPDKVSHYLSLVKDSIIDVPAMDQSEIKDLAQLHGCATGKTLDLWSNVIFIKTSGHPQLVHAKIRSLESSGWPAPTPERLVEPDNFHTVKSEVKKRLLSDFPLDSARILSYRLSILHHPFKRQHAVIMGEKSQAIDMPGEAFDLLVGPWIERLSSGYYRISPLLKNLANEIWSPDEIKALHAQAVQALLSDKSLSPIEASNAIFHGLAGEAGEHLVSLIYYLLTNKEDVLLKIAEDLRWLTFMALEPGQKIYSKNAFVSCAIRQVQFRVAAEIDKSDAAIKIADAWKREIETLDNEEMKVVLLVMFSMETLLRYEVPLPFESVIHNTRQIYNFLRNEVAQHARELRESVERGGSIQQIALFSTIRCKDYSTLLEFMVTLEGQEKETQEFYVSFMNQELDWAELLISKVYLNEVNAAAPNWLECLDAFNKTLRIALKLGATSIAAGTYRMIAVIYDENLENSGKAIDTLDEARRILGVENPVIEDARAMIYFRQKKDKEALGIWDKILPTWKTSFDPAPLLAYSRAEVSAARLGNWDQVSSFALQGVDVAKGMENIVFEIGFKADYAFSLWKSNDKEKKGKSLELFVPILKQFDKLPNPHEDLRSYTLQKKIGHAISWFLKDVTSNAESTLAEPPPACFSNSEVNEEIKKYPLPRVDFLFVLLAQVEYELKSGDNIFKYAQYYVKDSEYLGVLTLINKLSIAYSLKDVQIESLISSYINLTAAFDISRKNPDIFAVIEKNTKPEKTLEFYERLIELLCLASIIHIGKGKEISELITEVREITHRKDVLRKELAAWVQFAEEITAKTENEMFTVMNDPAKKSERLIASLLLSSDKKCKIESILYGNLLLFSFLAGKGQIWGREAQDYFEVIVIRIWRHTAETRGFALLSPRLNVPAILQACDDTNSGLKKVAKILIAASNAVSLNIPSNMMQDLRANAES